MVRVSVMRVSGKRKAADYVTSRGRKEVFECGKGEAGGALLRRIVRSLVLSVGRFRS